MARGEAHIKTTIWDDADWLALPWEAQWLYQTVLSQRDLSWCGVLTWSPGRIARLAKGLTRAKVEAALKQLVRARFVVVDRETDELWVRRLVKWEKVMEKTNVLTAATHDLAAVHSQPIRDGLAEQFREGFPDGLAERFDEQIRKRFHEGFQELFRDQMGGSTPRDHVARGKGQTSSSGSAALTGPVPGTVAEEEEEEDESLRSEPQPTNPAVVATCRLVAERRLSRRRGEPVTHRSAWLRKAAADVEADSGELIAAMLADGAEPAAVAEAVDRPANGAAEAGGCPDCGTPAGSAGHAEGCPQRVEWDFDEQDLAVRR